MNVETSARQILIHGIAMILAGLVWGLFVPATPYPRLALTAHIQFESNGLLWIVAAILLIKLPHCVGPRSMIVILISTWLTWPMVLSEMANSWWGTNQMLPIAAAQAGATGGEPWQEMTIKLTHMIGGLVLMAAWGLILFGFVRKSKELEPEKFSEPN